MPLIKSTSKRAFEKNVATEIKAGKPLKQSLAIAYSENRSAGDSHSSHSADRSRHYHSKIVPNAVKMGATKMTRLEQKKTSMEDDVLTGHTQRRQP